MLNTNLLPPREKKEARTEEMLRASVFFAIACSLVFIFGSLLLLPSYLPLLLQRNEWERAVLLEEKAAKELKVAEAIQYARSVKNTISSIEKFIKEAPQASEALKPFFEGRATGVEISSLNIKKGGAVSIAGLAKNRKELLDFEKKLRESGRFENLSIPLSSIVRESNINFSLQGVFKAPYGL